MPAGISDWLADVPAALKLRSNPVIAVRCRVVTGPPRELSTRMRGRGYMGNTTGIGDMH